jgi:anti-anti-sigma factor
MPDKRASVKNEKHGVVTLQDLFGIAVSQHDGHPVIRVNGDVDLATAATLADVIDVLLKVGEPEVLLDLSNSGAMDSAGVAVIANAAQRTSVRVIAPTRQSAA